MRDAFGWSIEQFLLFGGYPGAAPLIGDVARWRAYVLDSLVETAISRDVLLTTRVDKPALLRQLYHLAVASSGQILAYTKMLGQLHDAGNTTTLAHYLELLTASGLVTGLQKYAGTRVRQRASSPKLQVFDTALMTVTLPDPTEWLDDPGLRGRLVEYMQKATNEAKMAASKPVEVLIVDIIEGEFFVYEKCLWLRLRDRDLLGSKLKQYEKLSDENGLFSAIKPGTDGKELNPDSIRVLADDTVVHKLKLSW